MRLSACDTCKYRGEPKNPTLECSARCCYWLIEHKGDRGARFLATAMASPEIAEMAADAMGVMFGLLGRVRVTSRGPLGPIYRWPLGFDPATILDCRVWEREVRKAP